MTNRILRNIYLLKNIIRYNNKPKLSNESVAEHSFFVALISLLIADERNVSDSDKLKILIKALLHDMPEIETNDITHDVKVRLNLYDYLKKYEDDYYKRNFPQYFDLMSENDDNIDDIVNLADAYSVMQYANAEIDLGNKSEIMLNIQTDASNRITDYDAKYKAKLLQILLENKKNEQNL